MSIKHSLVLALIVVVLASLAPSLRVYGVTRDFLAAGFLAFGFAFYSLIRFRAVPFRGRDVLPILVVSILCVTIVFRESGIIELPSVVIWGTFLCLFILSLGYAASEASKE